MANFAGTCTSDNKGLLLLCGEVAMVHKLLHNLLQVTAVLEDEDCGSRVAISTALRSHIDRRQLQSHLLHFSRSVVLSRTVRDMERGRRGYTLNNNVFNDRKQRAQEHGYK